MRVNEVTIIFSSLIISPCHISRRGKFNNFGHETVDMHNGRAHCGEKRVFISTNCIPKPTVK